jgi:C1A family cysteine protease
MLTEYGFGRLHAPDPRDAGFKMRGILDPLKAQFFPQGLPDGVRHYVSGAVLNQGNTGTCVAHGMAAKISASPIMQPLPMSVFDFYRRCVATDEWQDNDHEVRAADHALQSGTSVRAAAKVGKAIGLIKEYRWADSAEDVRGWMLSGFGGIILGINWKNQMMDTDSEGFIHYAGPIEGGHCVYLNGWSDRVKHRGKYVRAARGQNSWGSNWGQKGRFWIPMDDLDASIADDGEASAMIEIKLNPRVNETNVGGDPAKR